ncbi:MAG: GGDEF domain-containing protein [Erythrobacter sp.]|jgi:diguanylate cyclase|nr:GGDEF domain-containing protein [Erythrobacter sp.]
MPILTSSPWRLRRPEDGACAQRVSTGGADAPDAATPAPQGPEYSRAREARRELLERITDFVLEHDFAVTSGNLGAICSALSGANAQLAEAFAAREISGEPIDQRWLDQLVRLDPATNERMSELERLMDQMEYSLIRFAQTTRSAHAETSDHRGAIDAEIAAMAEPREGASALAEVGRVIGLSRAMLEHVGQIENAMERSRAETEALRENLAMARMEADIDHLTRLPNRRAFERRLTSDNARARAKGEALCVAFCDVDHFKLVNDRHGHDAGDRILCMIGAMLNTVGSDDCFVARHGGEEFVLLFYGLDKNAAALRLDGVRAAIAAKQLMNRETGKPFGKVTFSGGVADVTEEADPRSALARADAALYEAKQAGRNRIVTR